MWDEERSVVVLRTSAYIHEGSRSFERVLQLAVLSQNIEAHAKAHQLAELVGGDPAASEHPALGERPEMDQLLEFGETHVIPIGRESSHYGGPWLAALSENNGPWLLATGDESAMTGELAYDEQAMPAAMQTALGVTLGRTSLFQITTHQTHPAYGNGALVVLKLPDLWPEEEATDLAHGLNRAESVEWTGFPQWGAWSSYAAGGQFALAFSLFLPNVIFDAGLLAAVASKFVWRHEWARQRLRMADVPT